MKWPMESMPPCAANNRRSKVCTHPKEKTGVGSELMLTRKSHAKSNKIMRAPELGSLISRCWLYSHGMEVLIRADLSSQSSFLSWSHLIIHQQAVASIWPLIRSADTRTAMGAIIRVCAFSLLSVLLLLHCILTPSVAMASKERMQSRKLLQNVVVSSEKARRVVFRAAAAKAANKIPGGAEVSENLKKQKLSSSNPIQN